MLDSIYVGMTGLLGYSRGLRVIANNTANLNTPGFKGSTLQFADLFYANTALGNGNGGAGTAGYGAMQLGFGLNTVGTTMNFTQGELRPTGNNLDLAVDGQGMFILKRGDGTLTYTRAGQFVFNTDGVLVSRVDGAKVMGRNATGQLVEITLAGQMISAAVPTSRVKFAGNLSSTQSTQTVDGVDVTDAAGGKHTLSLKFTNNGATSGVAGTSWGVDVLDGTQVVGHGNVVFVDGTPTPDSATFSFDYTPAGQATQSITLDFSNNVNSFASGTISTLAMSSQDGKAPGSLTDTRFDATGTLVLTYSNGQTAKGTALALARFDSPDAVAADGDNRFQMSDPGAWHVGQAGDGGFGKVSAGVLEISNVDLSREFSELVIMQRGYQASSQVVSTANDMLQQLFSMKSK